MVIAQTRLSGQVTDAGTKEGLTGVSVSIRGSVAGTVTDSKGNFSLATNVPTPFTLLITSVGYKSQELSITGSQNNITIRLEEQPVMGQEVVVSASRVEESVLRSPVAVEKMDIRAIRETAAPSFYDALANFKGIDMTTQGLLFKSLNTRGFNATGNVRTVQMIDGMDNQAPGLNFPVDNIVGMPELDVESVEVLPGAASALYGPNAINGLILMNSKSPFLYQGLSATSKLGVMSASNRDRVTTPFYDLSVRYAKAFNNRFAFKVNLAYIRAQDWQATDYTNLNLGGVENGTRGPGVKTDYDGMNIYGDEVQSNINSVASTLASRGLIPQQAVGLVPNAIVSRTGFRERDLVDYNTKSFKTNVALHYRINDRVEAVAQVNYGYGTTVYTGTGRYSLRNFNLTQAKLELRGDNFTLRGYTTQERSGQSYTAGLAAVSMLNDIKPHATWFGEYVSAFLQARTGGQAEEAAHIAARTFADRTMPAPGSAEFQTLLDRYRNKPISEGGGAFLDRTNLYHAEGIYNFKNQIKFIDLLGGANYRQYQLRSNGTLFADTKEGRSGTIAINEYGAFLQASKSLFSDHLKLTASIRYDKNQNFAGQYTPRFSAVTTFGDHNFRISYQTGFRIPTTQNQYIDLATPAGTLIGGLPEFVNRYNLTSGVLRQNLAPDVIARTISSDPSIVQAATQYATAAITAQVTAGVTAQVQQAVAAGQVPNNPAAIQAAVQAGVNASLPGVLQQQLPGLVTQLAPAFALAKLPKYQPQTLQPERIQSIEFGYKGLIAKKLFVDAYYYTSTYKNFIGGTIIIVPTAAAAPGLPIESGIGSGNFKAYSRPANTAEIIKVNGFAISANYSLDRGFYVGGNFAQNNLIGFTPTPEQQYASFNTPKNRYNLMFGKRIGAGDQFGFNLTFRHQDSYVWEAGFVQPTTTTVPLFTNTIVPAVSNFDAQVSYKLSSMKSILKVGGTNLFGKPYIQAFGSAQVGSMYYVSLTFDELLN
ncbi:TonB-dependent receptor [Nibrella viscosa]|uniref:TonB-dependent receptor n=2 Tax=Nibrella viscosa TaxID=1084524 RepID=A0ABP8KIJ2_9BACT